jgi:hypothetical protein
MSKHSVNTSAETKLVVPTLWWKNQNSLAAPNVNHFALMIMIVTTGPVASDNVLRTTRISATF